jgi:hypothetical protein
MAVRQKISAIFKTLFIFFSRYFVFFVVSIFDVRHLKFTPRHLLIIRVPVRSLANVRLWLVLPF